MLGGSRTISETDDLPPNGRGWNAVVVTAKLLGPLGTRTTGLAFPRLGQEVDRLTAGLSIARLVYRSGVIR